MKAFKNLTTAIVAAILVNAVSSYAQTGTGTNGNGTRPGGSRAAGQNKPAARNYLPELKVITDNLSKKFDVKIVLDPSLFVANQPQDAAYTDPEKALDTIAVTIKGANWKRVYLPQNQANVLPAAGKLADTLRALDSVEQSGIVLENPATKKATTMVKDFNVTNNFGQELTAGQFTTTPIYVLYAKVGTDGRTMEDKYADLQRQSMDMMMSMTPDQLSASMAQGMAMFNNLDPATRSAVMGNMMRAGMQMFQNMSEADRASMMQSAMQAAQQNGGGGFGFPGAPGAAGGRGGRRPNP
ncbi:MAG: hypothetical protein ABJA67_05715 [Chthonomonadales bacterium]